jgi:hypothetical protein
VCLFACCLCPSIANSQEQVRSWQPGKFRGLVTGTSTTKDVIKVLGNPTWQGKPQEIPEEPAAEEWTSKIQTPQGLCCDVFFLNGVVDSITLGTVEVDQSEAGRSFGSGFRPVKYSLGADPQESGSAALCQDPEGQFTILVNPKRGLSLWLGAKAKVTHAIYSATNPIHQCNPDRKMK